MRSKFENFDFFRDCQRWKFDVHLSKKLSAYWAERIECGPRPAGDIGAYAPEWIGNAERKSKGHGAKIGID